MALGHLLAGVFVAFGLLLCGLLLCGLLGMVVGLEHEDGFVLGLGLLLELAELDVLEGRLSFFCFFGYDGFGVDY